MTRVLFVFTKLLPTFSCSENFLHLKHGLTEIFSSSLEKKYICMASNCLLGDSIKVRVSILQYRRQNIYQRDGLTFVVIVGSRLLENLLILLKIDLLFQYEKISSESSSLEFLRFMLFVVCYNVDVCIVRNTRYIFLIDRKLTRRNAEFNFIHINFLLINILSIMFCKFFSLCKPETGYLFPIEEDSYLHITQCFFE